MSLETRTVVFSPRGQQRQARSGSGEHLTRRCQVQKGRCLGEAETPLVWEVSRRAGAAVEGALAGA